MSTISNNIKVLREHAGDTQEAFAKRFKTTRANINAYEGGNVKKLPAELVEKITAYFKITSQQLLRQRLTKEDLNVTGRIESVTEVKLEAALRENELLKQQISDTREIIQLLKKGR